MRAATLRATILGIVAAAVMTGSVSAQTSATKRVGNETRLFQRFIEDGAVTENVWAEGQFRYQSFEDADVVSLGPILAVNVAEDLEIGGHLDLRTVDPEGAGTETGFTDLDVYGKIRISTEPTQVALGILLKLPTGDEEESLYLGTGEMDVAFFGGVRHAFGAVSLVGSAGLRINQDPETNLPPGPGAPEGETSVQLGGGFLFAVTQRLTGIIETSFETERIDQAGSDFRVTVGGDFRRDESLSLRFGVGGGSGDGAPELELIASGIFLF